MCETCKALDEWSKYIEDMLEETVTDNEIQGSVLLHAITHILTKRALYRGIPVKMVFNAFRASALTGFIRHSVAISNDEFKIRTGQDKNIVLSEMATILIGEYDIFEIPNYPDASNHINQIGRASC